MKPLQELLDDFLDHCQARNLSPHSLKSFNLNLEKMITYLAGQGVVFAADLRKQHLDDWLQHLSGLRTRRGLPLRPSSINRYLSCARSWLTFLVKRRHVRPDLPEVLEYVKEPDLLPTSVLTHAQARKLLNGIRTEQPESYRDRALLELLYSTGIRVAELLGLNVADVDLKNSVALVTGKGNKQRVVPIGKTALRHLQTYLTAIRPFMVRNHLEMALFLNSKGNRFSYGRCLHAIHTWTKKAGLDINVTPHTFRRSCTTELLRGGANMYHVKELLGHSSLNTLRHYAKLTINDLKKTHEKCHPREKDNR